MFVVYYAGEYDLDDNGNVIAMRTYHTTLEEAQRAADSWERETRCIATITYESE